MNSHEHTEKQCCIYVKSVINLKVTQCIQGRSSGGRFKSKQTPQRSVVAGPEKLMTVHETVTARPCSFLTSNVLVSV